MQTLSSRRPSPRGGRSGGRCGRCHGAGTEVWSESELGDGLHPGVGQVVEDDWSRILRLGATAEVAGIVAAGSEAGGILHERLPELDRAEFRAVLERIPHRGLRDHQPLELEAIGNAIAEACRAVSRRAARRRWAVSLLGERWSHRLLELGEGGRRCRASMTTTSAATPRDFRAAALRSRVSLKRPAVPTKARSWVTPRTSASVSRVCLRAQAGLASEGADDHLGRHGFFGGPVGRDLLGRRRSRNSSTATNPAAARLSDQEVPVRGVRPDARAGRWGLLGSEDDRSSRVCVRSIVGLAGRDGFA